MYRKKIFRAHGLIPHSLERKLVMRSTLDLAFTVGLQTVGQPEFVIEVSLDL